MNINVYSSSEHFVSFKASVVSAFRLSVLVQDLLHAANKYTDLYCTRSKKGLYALLELSAHAAVALIISSKCSLVN